MKRKNTLKERLKYQFDNYMSKGTIALVCMLFLITAVVVVISGTLATIGNGELSAGTSIWQSLMHALDAGTLAGDDTGNIYYIILMAVVTICGIFVTSILIGIISTGFESKLNDLRKGLSKVLEANHTVIIGFSDSIYTILNELIEANANQKNACIVIIGEEEKEVMDEEIRSHIDDFKTTRIICRSGNFANSHLLEMASVETSQSIIINQDNDFTVIKALLALVSYLKSKNSFEYPSHITTLIHDKENLEAARIAGEGKAEIIFFQDILSRIIAHTCRQPGLSLVLSDFFGYGGAEFYYEHFPDLAGSSFGDILNSFEFSTVVGIYRDEENMLNPPMDTILKESDFIIHLAEDDGISKPSPTLVKPDLSKVPVSNAFIQPIPFHLLVLGYNDSLYSIIKELNEFVIKGSRIVVACDNISTESAEELHFSNIEVQIEEKNIYKKSVLENILTEDFTNILLLSSDSVQEDEADSKTMLLLLQLRDIAFNQKREFDIISEMHSVENQKLSTVARVNDFVVGSSITHLVITQVSQNRNLSALFQDILDADGSELYMKPASTYIDLNTTVDFYTLTEIVKTRNEIIIGYKKNTNGTMEIVTNPPKSAKISFDENDYLIVFAEN